MSVFATDDWLKSGQALLAGAELWYSVLRVHPSDRHSASMDVSPGGNLQMNICLFTPVWDVEREQGE